MFFVVVVVVLNQANPFLLKFLVDAIVKRGSGGSVGTTHFVVLLGLLFGRGPHLARHQRAGATSVTSSAPGSRRC